MNPTTKHIKTVGTLEVVGESNNCETVLYPAKMSGKIYNIAFQEQIYLIK